MKRVGTVDSAPVTYAQMKIYLLRTSTMVARGHGPSACDPRAIALEAGIEPVETAFDMHDGEIILPSDMRRIHEVVKQYQPQATSLVMLSPKYVSEPAICEKRKRRSRATTQMR